MPAPAPAPSSVPTPSPPTEVGHSQVISESTSTAAHTETPSVADPQLLADSSVVSDVVSNVQPLHYGDLSALGVVDLWPSGVSNQLLEAFQVTTGLPWFYAIIGYVTLMRATLLPINVLALQQNMRLASISPVFERVRKEMAEAKDMLTKRHAMLKMQKAKADAGVNMWKVTGYSATNILAQIGVWFGIRRMCTLPVEQLTWSGVSFLPDLTVADPMCTVLASAVLQVALTVSRCPLPFIGVP